MRLRQFAILALAGSIFYIAHHIAAMTGFIIILSVAVVKALLVCAYFMHLKWDWSRLYFVIIPALVLAPMLVFALTPDLVLYWQNLLGWNVPPIK